MILAGAMSEGSRRIVRPSTYRAEITFGEMGAITWEEARASEITDFVALDVETRERGFRQYLLNRAGSLQERGGFSDLWDYPRGAGGPVRPDQYSASTAFGPKT